jgi:hypothetical protein
MNKLLTALILTATAATAQAEENSGLWGWIKDHSCGGQWSCSDTKVAVKSHNLTDLHNSIKDTGFSAMLESCRSQDRLDFKPVDNVTQSKLELLVKQTLKDPDSAKFTQFRTADSYEICKATTPYQELKAPLRYGEPWEVITKTYKTSKPAYVGTVNAKNSYGGYVGATKVTVYENGEIEL